MPEGGSILFVICNSRRPFCLLYLGSSYVRSCRSCLPGHVSVQHNSSLAGSMRTIEVAEARDRGGGSHSIPSVLPQGCSQRADRGRQPQER